MPKRSKPSEPFGRQPQPVTVTLSGDPRDYDYYIGRLRTSIDNNHGDQTVLLHKNAFKIYPRAVND